MKQWARRIFLALFVIWLVGWVIGTVVAVQASSFAPAPPLTVVEELAPEPPVGEIQALQAVWLIYRPLLSEEAFVERITKQVAFHAILAEHWEQVLNGEIAKMLERYPQDDPDVTAMDVFFHTIGTHLENALAQTLGED